MMCKHVQFFKLNLSYRIAGIFRWCKILYKAIDGKFHMFYFRTSSTHVHKLLNDVTVIKLLHFLLSHAKLSYEIYKN